MQRDEEPDCDRFLGNCPTQLQAGCLPSGRSPEVLTTTDPRWPLGECLLCLGHWPCRLLIITMSLLRKTFAPIQQNQVNSANNRWSPLCAVGDAKMTKTSLSRLR